MGDDKSSGCGALLAAIITAIIAALAAAYAKSPCGFYRTLNSALSKSGRHVDPPRKFVGTNVSFSNCSAAQQASIKTWMEKGYDRLVADCWKNLIQPGVDATKIKKIRDRIVDYLTCEPLKVICDPAPCTEKEGRCAFVDQNRLWAKPKELNVCPSKANCSGDLTPAIVHEIAHLAEFDVTGWSSEGIPGQFGSACS